MSRMRDAVMAHSMGRAGAGGRDLVRVTDRHPCPVCERSKLCRVTANGVEVWCSRVSDGATRTMPNALGDVYVHRAGARRWTPPPAPPPTTTDRADVDTRDAAYGALLARLRLNDGDRAALLARGLTAEHINLGGYSTLPLVGRSALARVIVDLLGEPDAARVPGIVRRTDDTNPTRWWWSLAGAPGLIIPVRDDAGRIVALKVRRRDSRDGPRYTSVSSAAHGGPRADAALHVPLGARALHDRGLPLVITEGELKADVCTTLAGRPVVSVPGVGRWPLAVELARSWGACVVCVAFDADAATTPDVARHQRALLTALRAAGVDARLWQWPLSAGKGLDDFFLAHRALTTTTETSP